MKKIWVGTYQSDMDFTNDLFYGSITYYGNNKNNNCSCCSLYGRVYDKTNFIKFIIKNIQRTLGEYEYFFYNQNYALEIINHIPDANKYIIYLNDANLINWLNNKTFVRSWLQNIISVPPFCVLAGSECKLNILKQKFLNTSSFIIQNNYSSGGAGTYIFNEQNELSISQILNKGEIYLVSPYLCPSYSLNVHVLVGETQCILFPPSIQIVLPDNYKLLYKGSDFIEAKNIPKNILTSLYEISQIIGNKLALSGYRGICGLDFLVSESKVYFMEINPRFQGSSILINKSLYEANLPSLYELNIEAFHGTIHYQEIRDKIQSLEIPYSYYKLKKSNSVSWDYSSSIKHCKYVHKYYDDGFEGNITKGYLFKIICRKNLISITADNDITIYENLLCNYPLKVPPTTFDDWELLKMALLLQGLVISETAKKYIESLGGIKEGTFDSIDLIFNNNIVINCPLKIPFVEFSPFKLTFNEHLFLLYCDNIIDKVKLDVNENTAGIKTHSGLPINKLIQRNNDRLRIRHNSICYYKEIGKGCKFCHAKNLEKYSFDLEDIYESLIYYLNNFNINEVMIGGASNSRAEEGKIIKKIISIIRNITNIPIYIMSIPPEEIGDISEYKMLGANDIAFNIEIYDDNLAQTLMPGKGYITRKEYLNCLKEAVKYFGASGNVRSMIIIGFESLESFIKGITELCKIGVSPMISPFRPMENTFLQNYVPPTLEKCKTYFMQAIKICTHYKIKLGPLSRTSQNNTLNKYEDL